MFFFHGHLPNRTEYGVTGCLMIISGLELHGVALYMLMRPVSSYRSVMSSTMELIIDFLKELKKQLTSTTPSCSRPITAQKIRDKLVPGAVFFHNMPKMDFFKINLIVLVGKNTLNWYITCHGYINNYQSSFTGPIKNDWQFWKITPL